MAEQLKSLTPQQAWDLINENARALLVDIRSSMEYLFVGHPKGAVHVAWIDEPDWVVNPHFVTEIRQLILGGVVEDDAEGELDDQHHRSSTGGWRYHNLPWEQC